MLVIGLFGISGSGKSYVTQKININNLVCTRASSLLSEKKRPINLELLDRSIINDNQVALLTLFNDFKELHSGCDVLIELHNIVETLNGHEVLPESVIHGLELDAAIFYEVSPKQLFTQRELDTKKIRKKITLKELSRLQTLSKSIFLNTFSNTNTKIKVIQDNYLSESLLFIEELKYNF
ncbi:AAA family ATPase [Pseudoalteromonas fuliginea]|uniref:Adenylate kinase n=1 Tax=Pseudoalteromonas fuliginea TaxID=1872678 RepID=A0ABD3YAI8_9GAMM|nr:AAA family ATPase [Pseudoalteromonas fuliginea]KDC51622.1 hypothetical protein DC53_08625 [Pseudoalteromonas fuliginea]KJZ29712.1 hypothetical protein TW82_00215 [Pseudoalteromonas fuliginea]